MVQVTDLRAMGVPSSAIYMLGYEYLLTVISPIFTGTNDPTANASSLNRTAGQGGGSATLTPAPLIAGSLARTLSATVIIPIEMFRTRLQALPTGELIAFLTSCADVSTRCTYLCIYYSCHVGAGQE